MGQGDDALTSWAGRAGGIGQRLERAVVVAELHVAVALAHLCWRHKWKRHDMERSMLILEGHALGLFRHRSEDVEPLLPEQTGAVSQPAAAVVIAGDHDNGGLDAEDDPREDVVEQAHGVRRRHRAIEDVTCDQQGVRLEIGHEVDELLEDVRLVFEQRPAVKDSTEMPVGGVDESHGPPLSGAARTGCRPCNHYRTRP